MTHQLSSTWYIVSVIATLQYPKAMLITPVLDFYHMDYLTKSLSRRSSQRSTRPSSPQLTGFSRRSPTKKLNLAFLEDPLLASASAISSSMPMTPPVEEPTYQAFDLSTKMPRSPVADQSTDDDLESVHSESEPDVEKAHLVTHAKVYAIAEKYV